MYGGGSLVEATEINNGAEDDRLPRRGGNAALAVWTAADHFLALLVQSRDVMTPQPQREYLRTFLHEPPSKAASESTHSRRTHRASRKSRVAGAKVWGTWTRRCTRSGPETRQISIVVLSSHADMYGRRGRARLLPAMD